MSAILFFIKKHGSNASVIATILSLAYFGFWWIFKLTTLPGLHGDEAWFALKAAEFGTSGIHQVHGMTSYTGILQPGLISLFFKIFQMNILGARLGGVIFNLAALVILSLALRMANKPGTFIFFVIILSQSALYLISPRVSWKVNSFTFFFISVLVAATLPLLKNPTRSPSFFHSYVLLLVVLLGSYNHIIFSCIPLACLGALLLWSIYNRAFLNKYLILLLLTSLCNVSMLFFWMENGWQRTAPRYPLLILLAALGVIMLEVFSIAYYAKKKHLNKEVPVPPGTAKNIAFYLSRSLVYLAFTICIATFMLNHGIALIDVFSNYRLLMHAYSYQPPLFLIVILTTAAVTILGYMVFYLCSDIFGPRKSVFTFFILVYMGVFSFYPIKNSFRYYLALYIIQALFLAWKISEERKHKLPFFVAIGIMFISINATQIRIFSPDYKVQKALRFQIGNGQIETSAHFLPNKPVIDFLRKNEIGNINYPAGRYFLEQPIQFYKLIHPWKEKPAQSVSLSYDYDGVGTNGYKFE